VLGRNAPDSLELNPVITLHIDDYAGVGRNVLMEAEREATRIFRNAGVECRWENDWPEATATLAKARFSQLSGIHVKILPSVMTDRLGLPGGVMGLAPGSGPGRRLIYVLYDRVEALAGRQMLRWGRGETAIPASTAQILGDAIAHEIGHVLLSISTHSKSGIMRGDWDIRVLEDARSGYLLFTPEQAEVLRAEVQRRMSAVATPGS
jgi:hypothetical protein